MKKRLNSVLQVFFIVTILVGIGYNLYSEYSFNSDKIVLSIEDNFEENVLVSDMDFSDEDQVNHNTKNGILVKLNFENYHFKNPFLILKGSIIIWQPPKNYS